MLTKKEKKKNAPDVDIPEMSPKSPVAKREDRLSNYLKWSIVCHAILLIFAGVFATAAILKPDRVVVSEKDTGRIVGEYRTTAFRTNSELIGANRKFAENFLSLNSRTIYDDCADAMKMMSVELYEKRKAYLERSNLLKKIERGETKSRLEIKDEDHKILSVDGIFAKMEISGEIVVDQLRGDYSAKQSIKIEQEDVKLLRNTIPFKLVTDLKMVPVREGNTSGVEVIDYYEYE